MARKTSADSESSRGFADIIGVVLLAAAVLLLIAQWSFDSHDIGMLTSPPAKPTHNWIGTLGAYLAWSGFVLFGVVGYFLPALFTVFGAAFLLGFLHYLREHLRWSLIWSAGFLVSLTGLLFLADNAGWLGQLHEKIGAQSPGGWLGYVTYGETKHFQYGLSLLGPIGATIVYATLCLVSLLFLTGF